MDVDFNTVVARDSGGIHDRMIDFMRTSGVTSSALEHVVPEQMLSTPENPAEGVSAVKALQIANGQGIPIYTVTSANVSTVLPQLQVDEDVMNDIANAVAAGKEVTVSKTNIDFNGWNGCGYIVFDHGTGAGMYMINGGLNGSYFAGLYFGMMISLIGASLFLPGIGEFLVPLLAGVFGGAGLLMLALADNAGGVDKGCFLKGLATGLSLFGIITLKFVDVAAVVGSLIKILGLSVSFSLLPDTVNKCVEF